MENYVIKRVSSIMNVNIEDVIVIDRLSGGRSNQMYHVSILGEDYTFRIPPNTSHLFVNRLNEYENVELIKDLNINKEIVYFDKESGEQLAHFYKGKPLNELDSYDLNEVAKVLKKLHNSNIKAVNDYNPLSRVKEFEELCNNDNEIYFKLKNELLSFVHYVENDPICFCHGDSQETNYIKTADSLILADWEFAGNNSFYYDIASFSEKNIKTSEKLLGLYLGHEPKPIDRLKLYVYRTIQLFQWFNVAVKKDQIGLTKELNFDFMNYALNNLKLIRENLNTIKELDEIIKSNS